MTTDTAPGTPAGLAAPAGTGGRSRTIRDAAGSALGAVLGIAPHVLHHVGFIAGSALVTGTGGSVVFYAAGLALSLPMMLRLHRRFRTWTAPALALVVFSAIFAVSNLVIGPALSGAGDPPARAPGQPVDLHEGHHGAG